MENERTEPTAEETTGAWRAAFERGDASGAAACLAQDVTVSLPTYGGRYHFERTDTIQHIFAAIFEVTDDFRFETEVANGDLCALFFRATIGNQKVAQTQLLRLGGHGLIIELTLYGHPPLALNNAVEKAVTHAPGGLGLKPPRPGLIRAHARPTRKPAPRAIGRQ